MSDDQNNLSHETAKPVFLITTENALGRSSRWVVFGIGAAFGLLISVAACFGTPSQLGESAGGAHLTTTRDGAAFVLACRVAAILWGLTMILASYLVVRFFALRGAWILDSSGIEFQPQRGSPKSLKWSQVEAVRTPWSIDQIRFRGGGVNIPLTLAYEEQESRRRIRAALESWLGGSFDLRFHSQPMTRGAKIKLLAVTAPVALCLCAAAACVAYDDPYQKRKWLTLGLLLIPIVLVPLSAIGIGRWKHPQAHSSWRYRNTPTDELLTDEAL